MSPPQHLSSACEHSFIFYFPGASKAISSTVYSAHSNTKHHSAHSCLRHTFADKYTCLRLTLLPQTFFFSSHLRVTHNRSSFHTRAHHSPTPLTQLWLMKTHVFGIYLNSNTILCFTPIHNNPFTTHYTLAHHPLIPTRHLSTPTRPTQYSRLCSPQDFTSNMVYFSSLVSLGHSHLAFVINKDTHTTTHFHHSKHFPLST